MRVVSTKMEVRACTKALHAGRLVLGSAAEQEGSGAKAKIGDLVAIRFKAMYKETVIDDCFKTPNAYYYRVGSERGERRKFPATISYTIRKGPAKYSNICLWSIGWAMMWRVFRRRGDILARSFAVQMYSAGFLAVAVFPVG